MSARVEMPEPGYGKSEFMSTSTMAAKSSCGVRVGSWVRREGGITSWASWVGAARRGGSGEVGVGGLEEEAEEATEFSEGGVAGGGSDVLPVEEEEGGGLERSEVDGAGGEAVELGGAGEVAFKNSGVWVAGEDAGELG